MLKYALKRLGQVLPLLFLVSVVIFGMTHLMPGDPATTMLGTDAQPEDIERVRQSLGLDLPVVVQYGHWLLNFVQGDFGVSYITGEPVRIMVARALPITFSLAIGGTVVALLIGVSFALIAGVNKKRLPDYIVLTLSLVGISVPVFVLGIMLVLIFAVWIPLFPSQGYIPLGTDLGSWIRYLVLPSISLGMMNAAIISRTGRSAVIEVLGSDYVVTARASRVSKGSFYLRHVLRNASIPIMTLIGLAFGTLLGGAVVTERVFNMPGIGTLVIEAIDRRDYPILQAAILIIAVSYLLVNLVIDLLYAVVDPRVRYDA